MEDDLLAKLLNFEKQILSNFSILPEQLEKVIKFIELSPRFKLSRDVNTPPIPTLISITDTKRIIDRRR